MNCFGAGKTVGMSSLLRWQKASPSISLSGNSNTGIISIAIYNIPKPVSPW
jgi:fumarylacetoacetate (FAA) hydrolase family protein